MNIFSDDGLGILERLMKGVPNIICLGHVCIDHNTTEHAQYIGWGSGTLYMSSYFQKLGLAPRVITAYGPDMLEYAHEFTLLPSEPNRPQTLTFENVILPDKPRRRYGHKTNMSLPPALTPELKTAIAEADMVVAAMIVPTYSAEWLTDALSFAKPTSPKVLCPQGYLRSVGSDGLVSPRTFEEAPQVLPLFDLVFISEEDAPDAIRVAQDWKRLAPEAEIIVTNGANGATIIGVDNVKKIPTTPIPSEQIVDSVGCGSVFAAAVSMAYFEGNSLEEAVTAGHAAAAKKLLAAAASLSEDSATYKEQENELAERLTDAAEQVVIGGTYEHYKGGKYIVRDVALLEATLEPCVVYQAQYGDGLTFVRPLQSWLEEVELEGGTVPRFEPLNK